ncbi:MAG: hypothetical protein Q8R15_05005 [Candidatus Micrarchaeota archaeon]|nr:hypothetical protein [Candidatus Micrarchaeota archaeon]
MVRTIEAAVKEINKLRSSLARSSVKPYSRGSFVKATARVEGRKKLIVVELRRHKSVAAVGFTSHEGGIRNAFVLMFHEPLQSRVRLQQNWQSHLQKAGYGVASEISAEDGSPGFSIKSKGRNIGAIVTHEADPTCIGGITIQEKHFLPIVRRLFGKQRGRK